MVDLTNPESLANQGNISWENMDADTDFNDVTSEPSNEPKIEENSTPAASESEENPEQPDQEVSKTSGQTPDERSKDTPQPTELAVEIPEVLANEGIDIQDGVVGKYVKINGEEHFVALKELGNDFSGQKEIQRRFTEYDRQNKEWKKQVDEVNSYINQFSVKMQDPKQGPIEAMAYLGELSGVPAYEIKEQLIQALRPEIERRANLSSAELRAERMEAENKYLRERSEYEKTLRTAEQANKELISATLEQKQAYDISDQEWDSAIEFVKGNPNYANQANNPQFISELVRYERADIVAPDIIKQVDPELLRNENFYSEVLKEMVQNNYTQEDMLEVIEGAYELAKKNAVSTKLVKKAANKAEVINKQPSQPKPVEGFLDWDDL